MFQFTGFPTYSYGFTVGRLRFAQPGFPIQISADHWIFAPPQQLFAAYHVFHRLLVPRHPPCALIRLTSLFCARVHSVVHFFRFSCLHLYMFTCFLIPSILIDGLGCLLLVFFQDYFLCIQFSRYKSDLFIGHQNKKMFSCFDYR